MEKARRTGDALYMLLGFIVALVGKVMIGGIGIQIRPLEQTEALPAIIALIGWILLAQGCGMIVVSLVDLLIVFCRMGIAKYKIRVRHPPVN